MELNETTCKYCGKENIKNMGSHKRFCKKNPELAMKSKGENQDAPIPTPTGITTEPVLFITDITPCLYKEVAWYNTPEGQTSKQIGSIGILHTEKGENIPCALVMASNGILMPAFMIDGFLGMHKDGMHLSDTDDEPFPPFPEEENTKEPTPVPTLEPIEVPKKSLLSKLFGKKEEKTEVSSESQTLIKEAINASG